MSGRDESLNVLLVEDSEDDRYFFDHAFHRAQLKAKLFVANDGQEVIDFFQHQGRFAAPDRFPRPDVVFLDLKMPGHSGFDVLRWMREHRLLPAVKVIVLSGSDEPQDIQLCRELGAEEYIVKPIDTALIRKLLAQ